MKKQPNHGFGSRWHKQPVTTADLFTMTERNRPSDREWPKGALKLVSREAYDAVRRSRGYDSMTPNERLRAAQEYDKL